MPTTAENPINILTLAYEYANKLQGLSIIDDQEIVERIKLVAQFPQNRSCIRFLLACALAKIHAPEIDIRKPYTEIGISDTYSGRRYDELYVGRFLFEHHLDCSRTTAFLTATLRNRATILTPDLEVVTHDPVVYRAAFQLLEDVQFKKVSAENVINEAFRWIPSMKSEISLQLPLKVFYCYAHEDRALKELLDNHLEVLKRLGQIVPWHDREILPGANWQQEISVNLNAAHIILLLISSNFMRSDYCYGVEMLRALERHKNGDARVIPIIMRPVAWKETPIGEIQVLPEQGKPVTSWRNRDEAFQNIVQGIKKVVNVLLEQQYPKRTKPEREKD